MTTITGDYISIINEKKIVIHPFNKMNTTGGGYDLSIGYWILAMDNGNKNYEVSDEGHYEEPDRTITVPPNGVLAILAKEYIALSNNYMGTIHSKARHSLQGIILNSTTVDPNWEGRMTFILRNSSAIPVEIQSSTTFATLLVHKTSNIISGKPQFPQDAILSETASWIGEKTSLQDYLQGQTTSREVNEKLLSDQNLFIKKKQLVEIYNHNKVKYFFDKYSFFRPLLKILAILGLIAILFVKFGPMSKEISGTLTAITSILTLIPTFLLFIGNNSKS